MSNLKDDYAGLWDSMSTQEERDIEAHFEDFRDGLTDNCDCNNCKEWREQERRDLENV